MPQTAQTSPVRKTLGLSTINLEQWRVHESVRILRRYRCLPGTSGGRVKTTETEIDVPSSAPQVEPTEQELDQLLWISWGLHIGGGHEVAVGVIGGNNDMPQRGTSEQRQLVASRPALTSPANKLALLWMPERIWGSVEGALDYEGDKALPDSNNTRSNGMHMVLWLILSMGIA